MQQDTLSQGFGTVWKDLFSSPVHLDSLLSRQTPRMKSVLAQVLPLILQRPVSLAEDLGIGVAPGEPWSLSPEQLRNWPAATQMALELHSRMQGDGAPTVRALEDDFPPKWVAELKAQWSDATVRAILTALVRRPPVTLRFSRKVDRAQVLAGWKKSGTIPVKVTETGASPVGLELADYTPVFHLPEYERGEFEIQDEGSQVMSIFALEAEAAAHVLRPEPGAMPPEVARVRLPEGKWGQLRVADACAGAGGKSLAMADLMKGQGRVFSYDISDRKIQALKRRARHAGLNNIQGMALVEGKELEALSKFEGTVDRVLVDAPCSGWGVLKRNPDIKWRQDREALDRFPGIQLRLLKSYSTLVKPGGQLTFGTCTFRKSETLEVVQAFNEELGARFRPVAGGFFGPAASDGFFMQAWVRI